MGKTFSYCPEITVLKYVRMIILEGNLYNTIFVNKCLYKNLDFH